MQGRICALGALLLTLAITVAPAQADQTLHPGDVATTDAVVTSWTIEGAAGRTVQLRSTQDVGRNTGPATLTTATSDSVTPGSESQTFAARLPIAAGGKLALLGGTGSETVTATVVPDNDGDGYADLQQDECPEDFADHQRPCGPTQTIGSPLLLAPDPDGFSGSGSPIQAFANALLFRRTQNRWIVTHWRFRAQPGTGDTVLQLLHRDPGDALTVAAETAPIHVTTPGVVTVPAQIPTDGNVELAARSVHASGGTSDLGAVAYGSQSMPTRQPPATQGQTVAFGTTTAYANRRLLVQADLEPDADGDGKGDVTQDQADLVLTGSGPAEVGALESATQSFTVRNAGPDKALNVAIAFRRNGDLSTTSDRPGMSCISDSVKGEPAWVCQLGTLARGESATVVPGRDDALIAQVGPTVKTVASVTAYTGDPDPSNNSATLSTTRRPYVPNLAPAAPFSAPPCAHVTKGTRDDDVLRGTAFGDRLVGNDGGDLLKGGGGDDCLEGGAGNDVLDGGDGHDRLAGASGKDRLTGGNGDDKLTGGKGNDRLSGGNGNDTLSPGDGHDAIAGGPGNDTINAVDGVRETVDCGRGRDTVRADRRDRLLHCEKITRRR